MDWTIVLGIIIGNAALFLPIFFWMRSEANADRRELQNTQREDRKDLLNICRSLETTMQTSLNAIREEIKDFHGRLCAIEEKRK